LPANFADVLGQVYYTKEPVIVEKNGKPVAVVISPGDCERYRQNEKGQLFQVVHEIQERNRDQDLQEIEADIAAAVEDVRSLEHAEASATLRRRPLSAAPRR
jgi:prevent-host-death family protein